MRSPYWIKLYHEILNDPKMGRLPDRLWRRAIECFLLAGEQGEGGYLPDVEDMAWTLRCEAGTLEGELAELAARTGIVERRDGRWFVVKFAARQAAVAPAERKARQRVRDKEARYYGDGVTNRDIECHDDVTNRDTKCHDSVTNRDTDIDKDIDIETETETETDTETETESPGPDGPEPSLSLRLAGDSGQNLGVGTSARARSPADEPRTFEDWQELLRQAAATEIIEWELGKATQRQEHSGVDGRPIEIIEVSS